MEDPLTGGPTVPVEPRGSRSALLIVRCRTLGGKAGYGQPPDRPGRPTKRLRQLPLPMATRFTTIA